MLVILPMIQSCNENQIDINSASASELEKLDGVGEKIAQYIVDARPFDSVDDLIEVYRIGEITLGKIKEQGLACVEGSDYESSEDEEEIEGIIEVVEKIEDDEFSEEIPEPIEREIISLNTKVIKSGETEKSLEKSNYAVYGLAGFCVLIGFLFWLKQRKPKNEFKE